MQLNVHGGPAAGNRICMYCLYLCVNGRGVKGGCLSIGEERRCTNGKWMNKKKDRGMRMNDRVQFDPLL